MMLVEFFGRVGRFVPDLASPGVWCVLGASLILAALALSGAGLRIVERLLATMETQPATTIGDRGAAPDGIHLRGTAGPPGNRTVKVVPRSLDETSMSAPMASTSCLTMANPSPDPSGRMRR